MVGSPEIGLPPFQSSVSSFLFFTKVFSFFTYLFTLSRSSSPKFSFLLPLPPTRSQLFTHQTRIQLYKPNSPCPFGEFECGVYGHLRMENLHAEDWQLWRKSLEAEDEKVWYGPNAFHVLSLITGSRNHF